MALRRGYAERGDRERGAAIPVLVVDVCLPVQQMLHDLHVAHVGRRDQRGPPLVVGLR